MKQLYLKTQVLDKIKKDHQDAIIKQYNLNETDTYKLLQNLRTLVTDMILENNVDFYEEVINYEAYEKINKEYVLLNRSIDLTMLSLDQE